MIGLLVIIVVSGVLLHFMVKKNITVLGIVPNQKRMAQFLMGFLFMMLINLSMIYIETLVKSVQWQSKPIDYGLLYNSFVYHIRSALTEDLIFRGAILYILIRKLGSKSAILISAFCFGIYHVFSYGMTLDKIIPMLYIILITGFTGYVWAYAFEKTESIALGLGLHLGFNLVMTCFYPLQPYGELLFTAISTAAFVEWNELYYSLFKGLYPAIMTLIFIKFLLKSNFKIFKKSKKRLL